MIIGVEIIKAVNVNAKKKKKKSVPAGNTNENLPKL